MTRRKATTAQHLSLYNTNVTSHTLHTVLRRFAECHVRFRRQQQSVTSLNDDDDDVLYTLVCNSAAAAAAERR